MIKRNKEDRTTGKEEKKRKERKKKGWIKKVKRKKGDLEN